MTNVESKDVLIWISIDTGTTFKKIVCLTDAGVASSKSSTDTDTRCGILTSSGNPAITFTGTAVTDTAPDADELSHNEIWALHIAGTSVFTVLQNTDGSVFLGGIGVFTDMSDTATQGQWLTFQFTIKISGVLSQSHVS